MSRQIDLTKPLTDEDKQYLASRGLTVEQLAERQAQQRYIAENLGRHGVFGHVPDEVLRTGVTQMRAQNSAGATRLTEDAHHTVPAPAEDA